MVTLLRKKARMSFGINGPDNIPAIQKAQNMMNNGGGGNLGYFQQEKKDKKEKNDEQDVLELSTNKKDENFDDINFDFSLDSIGSKIKNFWNKINSEKKEEAEIEEAEPNSDNEE